MKRFMWAIILSFASLSAAPPDISNLNNCIKEIRKAALNPPVVPTFETYKNNYQKLLVDLSDASETLPFVYKQAASTPLIQFLQNLGETRFLEIFSGPPSDWESAILQEIIPDASLAILMNDQVFVGGVNAFQEVVSDLYDGFLNSSSRAGNKSGRPIEPPAYGVIPPLVKFGNSEFGPYTWPGDATYQILGMGCGIVSLPSEQIQGGILAWTTLGHETGGHDITHADVGLLNELAQKVRSAILQKFKSSGLANYWANCVDEATADICGYLHMGPSCGFGLVGYFRALGNGSLRNVGYESGPHPIDILRGYLAASVVKRLNFKDASAWSQAITKEVSKDKGTLYLINSNNRLRPFPVSFNNAIASADLVAQIIMQSKLASLQNHSLQEIEDWTNQDQVIVDNLVAILKKNGNLPSNIQGSGFFAAHVVASATQAALSKNANLTNLFQKMQSFLGVMHSSNPTWSQASNAAGLSLLQHSWSGSPKNKEKHFAHIKIGKRDHEVFNEYSSHK